MEWEEANPRRLTHHEALLMQWPCNEKIADTQDRLEFGGRSKEGENGGPGYVRWGPRGGGAHVSWNWVY